MTDGDLARVRTTGWYRAALSVHRLNHVWMLYAELYVARATGAFTSLGQLPWLVFILPLAIPGIFCTLLLWAAGCPVVRRGRGHWTDDRAFGSLYRDLFWYRRRSYPA